MALFGMGKKPAQQGTAPVAAPAAGVPTDLVIQMKQQGMSNNQIIQNLQGNGYSSSQIFDAMNQADVKGAVEAAPPGAGPGPMPGPGEAPMAPGAAQPMPGNMAPAPAVGVPMGESMPASLEGTESIIGQNIHLNSGTI